MTYSAVYCALISKRLQNPLTRYDCYVERHHIIPKSEGGLDEPDNLVNLTAREHYIAHLLLAKIYKDHNMTCAVMCMRRANKKHQRDFKFNSRLYEKVRKKFADGVSKMFKGRPSPNKGRKFSSKTRKMMSISHTGLSSPKKGKKMTEEFRVKISKVTKGCNNPMYGRKHSEESRRKMSDNRTGKSPPPFTDEHKKRISDALKGHKSATLGKKRYFNGKVSVFAYECPPGFVEWRKRNDG